jgi:hypothetical protein
MPGFVRAVALALAAATTGAAPAEVGFAVVRPDGRLQPLARLEGDNWSPLPPADAAGTWSFWLFEDPLVKASPFSVRSARPVTAAAGTAACLPVSGLDAATMQRAPASATVPSPLGIALRGSDIRPDLPVPIAADSELGRQLAMRAAAAFHRAEDETLTLEAEELPAGFPRFPERRQRPVTWTLIVRQGLPQGPAKTYYLEGRKDYERFRGRTDICQIRTTGYVFVQMTGNRETIDAEVDLSDVEGHQSRFRTPLAIVAWPARSAWLFAARGPEGVQLEIVDVTTGTSRPRPVWQGPDGCERGHR